MRTALFIEGRRNGYTPAQCPSTITVGELRELLEDYDDDLPIFLCNDNGYTYGNITEYSITEDDYDRD